MALITVLLLFVILFIYLNIHPLFLFFNGLIFFRILSVSLKKSLTTRDNLLVELLSIVTLPSIPTPLSTDSAPSSPSSAAETMASPKVFLIFLTKECINNATFRKLTSPHYCFDALVISYAMDRTQITSAIVVLCKRMSIPRSYYLRLIFEL
jgi:hypothetical protein